MLKKIILLPLSFVESVADRVISVSGAVIFMQIPSFMIQYQQRLGGHVDELKILIGKYSRAAADNGRSLEEYINLHLQSGVNEFVSTGQIMTDNIQRLNMLNEAFKKISSGTGIKKFLVFLQNLDMEIIKGTYADFTPGISLNLDAVIYGISGIIIFMLLYFIIKQIIIITSNRFISKKSKGPAA